MRKLFVQTLFMALLVSPPLLYAQNEESGRLSLEDCIAKGLQNNPMIQSSQLFVEENQTKVDEARSGYYPKVSLNSNATTYSNNNGDQRFENYNTGISASYNLFSRSLK